MKRKSRTWIRKSGPRRRAQHKVLQMMRPPIQVPGIKPLWPQWWDFGQTKSSEQTPAESTLQWLTSIGMSWSAGIQNLTDQAFEDSKRKMGIVRPDDIRGTSRGAGASRGTSASLLTEPETNQEDATEDIRRILDVIGTSEASTIKSEPRFRREGKDKSKERGRRRASLGEIGRRAEKEREDARQRRGGIVDVIPVDATTGDFSDELLRTGLAIIKRAWPSDDIPISPEGCDEEGCSRIGPDAAGGEKTCSEIEEELRKIGIDIPICGIGPFEVKISGKR